MFVTFVARDSEQSPMSRLVKILLLTIHEIFSWYQIVQVHKEAHYKNGATPVKTDPIENDVDNESKQSVVKEIFTEDDIVENTYNDEDDYDHEGNDTNIDEEDDIMEPESQTDAIEGKDDKLNYSLTQDDFIEDVARVI